MVHYLAFFEIFLVFLYALRGWHLTRYSNADASSIQEELHPGRGIASAALIIGLGNLFSRSLGLGREVLLSAFFGTGLEIRPFIIADRLLTVLYDLLISGVVAAALIPVLSGYIALERREDLRRIVGTLITLAAVTLGMITILGEVFAPIIVKYWLTDGDLSDKSTSAAIDMVRLLLPAVPLLGISAILMATQYALGRFLWPTVAQAARNAMIVITIIALQQWFQIGSAVTGVLLGTLLLVLLQWPGITDIKPKLGCNLRHPAIRSIIALYAPIAIGVLASTIGSLIDSNLAWNYAGIDALGAIRFATQTQQFALGLVASGIALGALPTLSRQATAGNEIEFQLTLVTALRMTTLLITPASLGLLAVAKPLTSVLFYHGATTADGAEAITLALICYVPGTFFAAYDQLLINVFYARRNTFVPQIVGVAAVVLYISLEFLFVRKVGIAALAGAISIQWTFHALILAWLSRKLLSRKQWQAIGHVLIVCFGLGSVMALFVFAVANGISALAPGPRVIRDGLALLFSVLFGTLFYGWATSSIGIVEAVVIRRALLRGIASLSVALSK